MITYSHFLDNPPDGPVVLATILEIRGSTPEVSGASANFSAQINVPDCQGRRGLPLLFDFHLKDNIITLDRDKRLRQQMVNHPDESLELKVEPVSNLKDIDNKQDNLDAIKGG